MSKITTAREQAQEQRWIPYQPYAERGVATFASVLPARITITVGNDAALSTSDHFQIIFRSSFLLRHCSAKRSNAAYTTTPTLCGQSTYCLKATTTYYA